MFRVRESVLTTTTSDAKVAWLGPDYGTPGQGGNDIARTNVPDLRLEFRHLLLEEEMAVLRGTMPHDAPTVGMTEEAEACDDTTTQELAHAHAAAAHPLLSPPASPRYEVRGGRLGARVGRAAAVVSTLLRLDSGTAEPSTPPRPTARPPSVETALARDAAATAAAAPPQRRGGGAAMRLHAHVLPAVLAALLVGVLAGAARSRSRSS